MTILIGVRVFPVLLLWICTFSWEYVNGPEYRAGPCALVALDTLNGQIMTDFVAV